MIRHLHNAPFRRRRLAAGLGRRSPGAAPLGLLAIFACAAWIHAEDKPPDPDKPADKPSIGVQRNIRIELNDRAAELGITRREILRQIYARHAGGGVSVADLGNTVLATKGGKLVRLSEVATIHVTADSGPRPAQGPRKDGKVKSKVLTKALVELWPRFAALGGNDEGKLPGISPRVLQEITDATEAFWVAPAEEQRFRSGTFDDEYNAKKLAAVVRQYAKYRGELPKALAALQQDSLAGRLKGAQLELVLRMTSDILREERQRAAALARRPGGSKLSFRIAPPLAARRKADVPSEAEIERYRKDLADNGPTAGRKRADAYAWFEAVGDPGALDGLITATYEQRPCVLLCNRAPHVLLPKADGADAWGLKRVHQTTDERGNPAIAFEFDDAGGRRFASLTAAHKRRRLAVLVDDAVLSAPYIMAVISGRGIITGKFTRDRARELVWLLERGMKPPSEGSKKETRK